MSWLSKALGLDKRPRLLGRINQTMREAVDLADRALESSLKDLVTAGDYEAACYRLKTELAVIRQAKTAQLKDEILDEVLDQLK